MHSFFDDIPQVGKGGDHNNLFRLPGKTKREIKRKGGSIMGGRKKILIGLMGLFMLIAWGSSAWAIEYGNFAVSGWVRNQIALGVSGANPNNCPYLGSSAGCQEKPDLKLFHTSVQLKPQYTFTDKFSVFARLFAANEQAEWDNHVDDFNAFPKSYPGDWTQSDDNWMIGVKELYADFDTEYLWLRLGKQQVSWGQSDGLRLLDIVNPLDLSWHGINLHEPYLEAFDNLRESLWMARATVRLPYNSENFKDLQLEGLWLPGRFVGTTLPAYGSPYNVVPAFFVQDEERPNGQEFGVRFMGVFKRLEFSLNYFNHYEDDGLTTHVGPLWVDGADPNGPPNKLAADIEHPRVDSYGFSLSYDDNMNTKAVYRVEFLYEDRPYEVNNGIDRRDTIKVLLGIDRPTFIKFLNPNRTFSLGFQVADFWVIDGADDLRDDNVTLSGGQINEHDTVVSFSADTGYVQDRIKPNILYIYNTGKNTHYLQLGTELRFTDNFIGYVGGSFFGGGNHNPANGLNPGSVYWADEIQTRLSYQF
jgi:hypothetical protein